MDFSRIHDYCASLAVSAMITSTFFAAAPEGFMAAGAGPIGSSTALESAMAGLRADGWHGIAGMALPTVAATAQATKPATPIAPVTRPFTELQLQKLDRRWDTKTDFKVLPQYSKLLGLSPNGETIRFKKMSGKDDQGTRHLFGRLENGAGYFLTREPNSGVMHAYWVDRDFKVVAAIAKAADDSLSVHPASIAQKELEAEYKDWAAYADTL